MADESQAAVAEPAVETVVPERAPGKPKPKRQPRYNVILWDDPEHTHDYVVVMMQKLFGHPVTMGLKIAMDVDSQGRAIVLTTTREHAELKRDQIHAFGSDNECKGSMSASIEPVPE